ncbi:MAG: MerR family transcriptional regulator [Betaproteobacteria bacterium]|nr:MerR family transcriptional regulator [Betaproteobacteria bacterium]
METKERAKRTKQRAGPIQSQDMLVSNTAMAVSEEVSLRIGALSKLSGIPSPTLRAWERRYAAFTPIKTGSGQRLYARSEASRAVLIRGLADKGFVLSRLARCGINELLQLKAASDEGASSGEAVQANRSRRGKQVHSLKAAVIGEALALRLLQGRFLTAFESLGLNLQMASPPAKLKLLRDPQVNLVLMEVDSLLDRHCESLVAIKSAIRDKPLLVFYRFGAAPLVALLRHAGIQVYREPTEDSALMDALKNTCAELRRGAPQLLAQGLERSNAQTDPQAVPALSAGPVSAPVRLPGPRRYSLAKIREIAQSTPSASCECPRHVSEILEQLLAFEDYTERCLSHAIKDLAMHADLLQFVAMARSHFEDALEAVARHEGIAL